MWPPVQPSLRTSRLTLWLLAAAARSPKRVGHASAGTSGPKPRRENSGLDRMFLEFFGYQFRAHPSDYIDISRGYSSALYQLQEEFFHASRILRSFLVCLYACLFPAERRFIGRTAQAGAFKR